MPPSVIPDIAWGLTLTHTALAEDVTAQPLPTAQGHAEVLDRPGLGVEVDEERVRASLSPLAGRGWRASVSERAG